MVNQHLEGPRSEGRVLRQLGRIFRDAGFQVGSFELLARADSIRGRYYVDAKESQEYHDSARGYYSWSLSTLRRCLILWEGIESSEIGLAIEEHRSDSADGRGWLYRSDIDYVVTRGSTAERAALFIPLEPLRTWYLAKAESSDFEAYDRSYESRSGDEIIEIRVSGRTMPWAELAAQRADYLDSLPAPPHAQYAPGARPLLPMSVSIPTEEHRHLTPLDFSIGSFKAFSSRVDVPLNKVTLVFGANSSGKSSVLQGIAWATEGLERDDFATAGAVTGGAADFGGIEFLTHAHNRSVGPTFSWHRRVDELDARVSIYCEVRKRVALRGTDVRAEAPVVYVLLDGQTALVYDVDHVSQYYDSFDSGDHAFSFPFPLNHEILTPPIARLIAALRGTGKYEPAAVRGITPQDVLHAIERAEVVPLLRAETAHRRLRFEIDRDKYWRQRVDDGVIGPFTPVGRGPVSRETPVGERDATEMVRRSIAADIAEVFLSTVFGLIPLPDDLLYLGAIRSLPERTIELGELERNASAMIGGMAWRDILRDDALRKHINDWLGKLNRAGTNRAGAGYQIVRQRFMRVDDLADDQAVLRAYDAGAGVSPVTTGTAHPIDSSPMRRDRFFLALVNDRGHEVSYRDVGIGVSQMIPVLAYAFGAWDKRVLIEEPEMHLHPAMHGEVADALIESTNTNGNHFVIETHSEHLILRMLRRVRQTTEGTLTDPNLTLRPEDLSVVYVEVDPSTYERRVVHLPVTEDGDFDRPWPGGFFSEREEEWLD